MFGIYIECLTELYTGSLARLGVLFQIQFDLYNHQLRLWCHKGMLRRHFHPIDKHVSDLFKFHCEIFLPWSCIVIQIFDSKLQAPQ